MSRVLVRAGVAPAVGTEGVRRRFPGFLLRGRWVLLPAALLLLSTPSRCLCDEPKESVFERCEFRDREEFSYRFAWLGIPAATGTIRLREAEEASGQRMGLEFKVRSLPWLSLVWEMSATARATFLPDTMRPERYSLVYEENGRKTETVTVFDDENNVATVTRTRRGKTREVRFKAENAFDPLTFLMGLRCTRFVPGSEAQVRVISGTEEYLVKIRVSKREKISVRGRSFDAVKLEPVISRVGGDPDKKGKLKRLHAWISDDERRRLLKVEIAATVGAISCELVSESGSEAVPH